MNLDKKLSELPLAKSNPNALLSLFGSKDVTPMWIADMEFEVAKPIQDALIKRVSNSGFAYEYKPDSFFKAQHNWYQKRYGIDLVKEHILYSPSITSSIAVLLENFSSEKDGVITQPPVFMEFRDVIRKTKRRIVKNSLTLSENNGYEIDFNDLDEKAALENSKVLIICNPHNPVGRVWRKEELEKVVLICKKHDLLLISDEVHKDIVLFENTFTSVLEFTAKWDKMVVCTSEAKTFNLCGISDSMLIVPNEEIRNSVKTTFQKYNFGRTDALTRVALEAAYTEGEDWLNDLIATIEKNIKSIEEELKGSAIKFTQPEGTYQVWLDFRDLFSDSKVMFKELTANSGIAMNAGHWFGREGALFMRMNIATSNEKVVAAIRKVKSAV